MGTEQRQIRAQLEPPQIQLRGRLPGEPADIGAAVGHPAQPKPQHQRQRGPQPWPARRHIARPGAAVALQPRPARPGEQERPLLGTQFAQPLVPGPRHRQRVDVVRLPVVATAPLHGVPRRTGQRRIPEHREGHRLVHVMPEPGKALRQTLRVQPAPPLAHPRIGEVRIHRLARPHHPAHRMARGVPYEGIGRRPAFVHRIPRLRLDRRIDDRHQAHPVRAQLPRQPRQIREPLPVDGEDPVAVEMVDVQVDGRQREFAFPVAGHHPAHLLLAAEAPPGVLIPQRPPGRQRGRAGQRRPPLHHPRRCAEQHPVAQRPAVHPHLTGARPVVPGARPLRTLAQRHPAVPRVVVEHQMRPRIRHHQLHRHGQRQRIVTGPEGAARIGVPQPVGTVPQPRPARPAAQPEDPRIGRDLRALHPPGGATALRRCVLRARTVPPARRQLPPQRHTPRRPHLDRTVPGHRHLHPLRDDPPATFRVRLQHRPRIHLRTRPSQRIRRLRPGAVPAAEHRAAGRHPHPQRRPREADQPAAGPRLRARRRPRHPGPLRPLPPERPRIRSAPPPRRSHRPQPLYRPDRPDHPYRPHQLPPVHAGQPAIDAPPCGPRSTAVHLRGVTLGHLQAHGPDADGLIPPAATAFTGPGSGRHSRMWGPPWCTSRSHGKVQASRVPHAPPTGRRGRARPTHTTRIAREPHHDHRTAVRRPAGTAATAPLAARPGPHRRRADHPLPHLGRPAPRRAPAHPRRPRRELRRPAPLVRRRPHRLLAGHRRMVRRPLHHPLRHRPRRPNDARRPMVPRRHPQLRRTRPARRRGPGPCRHPGAPVRRRDPRTHPRHLGRSARPGRRAGRRTAPPRRPPRRPRQRLRPQHPPGRRRLPGQRRGRRRMDLLRPRLRRPQRPGPLPADRTGRPVPVSYTHCAPSSTSRCSAPPPPKAP